MTAVATGDVAVDARDLTKSFGSVLAVDHLSLQVSAGEAHALLGPNGAGKTTLLRMLFGLIRPDAGSISIFGRTWPVDRIRVLDHVGGFIESPKFYPYLTGRQNLEGLALLDGGVAAQRIDEVLDLVDLAGRAGDRIGGYSFGMRQRLGVAASLLRDPRLLVLDEPANGLDPAGIRDMRALVRRLAASGLTVLLSSHHMDEVDEICDNVTVLRRGTVAFHGTLQALRREAPEPGYLLETSDDARAEALAPHGVTVRTLGGGGLQVSGTRADVASYVAALTRAHIELWQLTPTQTPLEALFFMLTGEPSEAAAMAS